MLDAGNLRKAPSTSRSSGRIGSGRRGAVAMIMAVFMVLCSAGLNAWALQFITSGESALLNTTAALWIAGFGSFGVRGHPLSRLAVLGLILGVLGTALTLSPHFSLDSTSTVPYLGALIACLAWSIGTMYYRHIDTQVGSRPEVVLVSARTGAGLDELRRRIAAALDTEGVPRDRPDISNVRHIALVQRAHEALERARAAALGEGGTMPEEFVLADLQDARASLEEITGKRAAEDLLAHIFARFCVGK